MPETDVRQSLITGWLAEFPDTPTSPRAIIERAFDPDAPNYDLRSGLVSLVPGILDDPHPRRLVAYLASVENRPLYGWRIVRVGRRWSLARPLDTTVRADEWESVNAA